MCVYWNLWAFWAKVNEKAPSSQTAQLTNHMVAMKPTVPITRIGGKSFTVSMPLFFKMVNAVVLDSAMVGMKNATLMVYIAMNAPLLGSSLPKPAEAPIHQQHSMAMPAAMWHNPKSRCGCIYLSATMPMMVGINMLTTPCMA